MKKTTTGKRVTRKRKAPASAPPTFVEWCESTICLPVGLSANPGPIRLPIYLREIAESFAAPGISRIVCIKSARVGFSTMLDSLIAYSFIEDPQPVLVVVPAEADARNMVVRIEDTFLDSPRISKLLPNPSVGRREGRNTILYRRGPGGASLRLVGANSPRNLRAIQAKLVVIDESDACPDIEGDLISLCEARSLTFPDRRTIIGGTPLETSTSRIARAYAESDMRVYECKCPSCREYFEITFGCLKWDEGRPETVRLICPKNGCVLTEAQKPQLVNEGRWRALRPEIRDVRGYKVNALISSLPHATWPKIVAQYEAAKADDSRMQAFKNLILGEPWAEATDEVDESELSKRAEQFDLDNIPEDVLAVTIGGDCQGDRVELSVVGHARDNTAYVLGHIVVWGDPLHEDTWQEVDAVLRQRWKHPSGGSLKVDAAGIDSGGQAGVYDKVMAFCGARLSRRIMATKGVSGWSRPAISSTKTKKGRLFVVGVDPLKSQILSRLQRGNSIRFSHTLEASYYEQLAAERRVVKMTLGRPVARWEMRPGARRNEALDCLALALAARAGLTLNAAAFDQRELQVRTEAPPKPRPTVYHSEWMSRRAFE